MAAGTQVGLPRDACQMRRFHRQLVRRILNQFGGVNGGVGVVAEGALGCASDFPK